ncbi:MAG: DUF4178 domain-containing protein [Archangium sp.]
MRAAMKVGECPSCRAPVEFSPGSPRIKVCEYCNTVIARDGGSFEAIGKAAELVDTESPLKVGLHGRYGGTSFQVKGRIQKARDNATWDEWYLLFDDEREGWLAESEGEWKLLFPVKGAPTDWPAVQPLSTFKLKDFTFTVEEISTAETRSAEGELPSFNRDHEYIDATGPRGTFCTVDRALDGDDLDFFIGSFVTLGQLGFDTTELQPTPKKTALAHARCTNCNGPLDLKAPDATMRVACPYCSALISVEGGNLRFLRQLEKPPYEPLIPLGAVGRMREPGAAPESPALSWTCLAHLVRSCEVENVRYPWDEYLLWNRDHGFRWLMESNGHWTWLKPIPAGECDFAIRQVKYGKELFRQFQSVHVRTDYVVGECYWQVNAGETAIANEYVAPPRSINVDQTDEEATVTLGTLIDGETVRKAFSLQKRLRPPSGIAPAQENVRRKQAAEAWLWSLVWSGALVALAMLFSMLGSTEQYWRGSFSVPPNAAPASPEAQRFSEPFDIKDKVPLEVRVDANVSNNWLGVSVDLVNEATGEVIEVYAEPSYYFGGSGEDAWSEGDRTVKRSTDVVDKGRYIVRVTPHFEPSRAVDYTVTVTADDGPGYLPVILIILLLLYPVLLTVASSSFETEKWNDAVFQSARNVSTFPYAKDDDDD